MKRTVRCCERLETPLGDFADEQLHLREMAGCETGKTTWLTIVRLLCVRQAVGARMTRMEAII